MKNLIPFVAFSLIFLASCGGETVTTRSIQNNTGKDLKMFFYQSGKARDTLYFAPAEIRQISISTSNKGTDEDPDCVFDIDSAWAGIEGGGAFTKKIQDNNSWTSESDHVKRIPPTYENTCVFQINLSDFE